MKKQKEMVGTRTEDLLVDLADKEIDTRAREMAAVAGQLGRARDEKKKVMAEHAARLKGLEEKFDKLSETVREGRELRPVVVETWHDYKRGAVIEIRQDSGETIHERALSMDERQGDLAPGAKNPTPNQVAKKLFEDGVRPDDPGIDKKVEEASKADGVEAAAVLDALMELAEKAAEEKGKK